MWSSSRMSCNIRERGTSYCLVRSQEMRMNEGEMRNDKFRNEGEFVLDTDASDNAKGAVLSQEQDGEERVIAYGSHTMGKELLRNGYIIARIEILHRILQTVSTR